MSLMIYDKYDIPSEEYSKRVIRATSDFFDKNAKLIDCETIRNLMFKIDNAEYINEYNFKSNMLFCGAPDKSYLSAGCKAAICIYLFPDLCFDSVVCGINALVEVLQLDRGSIYLEPGWIYNIRGKKCDIIYKNRHFDYLQKFYNWRAENGFGVDSV